MLAPARVVLAILMITPAIGWLAPASADTDSSPMVVGQNASAVGRIVGAAGAANDCPKTGPEGYQINVHFEIPPVRIRRGLSAGQLSEMAFHGPKSQVLGVTKSGLQVETAIQFRTLPFGHGYCYWVDNIDVLLHYQVLDVFIAAKYAPDSCPYKAILAHEQKHVRAAQRHLDDIRPRLHAAFVSPRVPAADSPALATSMAAARHHVDVLLAELTQPVIDGFETAIEASRTAIDTPEEYRRVRERCPHW
jgi:hypothetical protein